MENKMINVRINFKIYEDFKNYCNENGYSISKRIRNLIENDMKRHDK